LRSTGPVPVDSLDEILGNRLNSSSSSSTRRPLSTPRHGLGANAASGTSTNIKMPKLKGLHGPGAKAVHSEMGHMAQVAMQTAPNPAWVAPNRPQGAPPKAAVICDHGHGCAQEDSVQADRVPLSSIGRGECTGWYRLHHIEVERLQKDGTLGLLLHGTSIVGFRSAEADLAGWRVGDQIVQINERRASNFEEFQSCFRMAQSKDGFPIDFGVLRKEEPARCEQNAEKNA
jgi:hypothetical protein